MSPNLFPPIAIVPCSAKSRRGIKSATMGLATYIFSNVSDKYPSLKLIDIGSRELPVFDGRELAEYESSSLSLLHSDLSECSGFLWIVPCYWNNVGPVFANAICLLAGPGYSESVDHGASRCLHNRYASIISVGADRSSGEMGANTALQTFKAIGARIVSEPLVINNPRVNAITQEVAAQTLKAAVCLIRAVVSNEK